MSTIATLTPLSPMAISHMRNANLSKEPGLESLELILTTSEEIAKVQTASAQSTAHYVKAQSLPLSIASRKKLSVVAIATLAATLFFSSSLLIPLFFGGSICYLYAKNKADETAGTREKALSDEAFARQKQFALPLLEKSRRDFLAANETAYNLLQTSYTSKIAKLSEREPTYVTTRSIAIAAAVLREISGQLAELQNRLA